MMCIIMAYDTEVNTFKNSFVVLLQATFCYQKVISLRAAQIEWLGLVWPAGWGFDNLL